MDKFSVDLVVTEWHHTGFINYMVEHRITCGEINRRNFGETRFFASSHQALVDFIDRFWNEPMLHSTIVDPGKKCLEALKKFFDAATVLVDKWDDDVMHGNANKLYPFVGSFDEFVHGPFAGWVDAVIEEHGRALELPLALPR